MKRLEKYRNVDIKVTTHYSIITICNWDRYQDEENTKGQLSGQPSNNQVTTKGQPSNTFKNVKKVKNVKNDKKRTMLKTHFQQFWTAYPRKKSKGQAEKTWNKIKPDAELLEQILTGIESARLSHEWMKDDGEFIPYPSTWLNAKGWEDEHTPYRPQRTGAKSTPEPSKDLTDWGEL